MDFQPISAASSGELPHKIKISPRVVERIASGEGGKLGVVIETGAHAEQTP